MHDIIIIGAGYAGLSAGALLARRDRRVLLLEKQERLGGRASYVEQDGFVWEYGQHSCRLAGDGIAARVFDVLGKPFRFVDTARHDSYIYSEGRLHPRPEGPSSFLRTDLLPFRSRLTFLRFYAKLLRQNPGDWYDKPLREMYRTWFDDPRVERFLKFLGFAVMMPDPARVSAGEVIAFLKRAAKARTKQGEPLGGTKQMIETLARVILEKSGEIHVSEPAVEIVVQNGKATGVRTMTAEYTANAVVFAAPVNHLFGIIGEKNFDDDFVAYVKNIQSSSGLSIDFVSDEPLASIRGSILGLDIPLWVKFQTNSDATVAPPGKHVSTWAMLFEPGATITKDVVDKAEKRIKSIMEEVLPGASSKVIRERKLVAPVINGNMLIPSQSYPHRPPLLSREVENLYFIGDTTQAEGCSGDIAFASALRLVEMLQT